VAILRFRWDPEKAAANRTRHGVSFEESTTVFGDPLAVTFFDPDHSESEDRYLTYGHSDAGRLLLVVHVDEGPCTRILSSRPVTMRERRQFAEGDW